jgi:TolA-binding protein
MPTLEKKTKPELEAQINDQAEQIRQMQQTIKDLQSKIELSNKERDVQRNLSGEKIRAAAINPQNLHTKLKLSGHPPDIQAQIMKNAN